MNTSSVVLNNRVCIWCKKPEGSGDKYCYGRQSRDFISHMYEMPPRPKPPKGQNPDTRKTIMDFEKLNKAIDEAAKKLVKPFNPAKYSGDYKYWSGLFEAKEILIKSNANN